MTDSAQPAQSKPAEAAAAKPAKPPAPEDKPFADFVPNLLIPATLELGGKSPNIFFEDVIAADDDYLDKAIEGRMEKFFQAKCLVEMSFVNPEDQNDTRTVEQARQWLVGKIGENIQIRRFHYLALGS